MLRHVVAAVALMFVAAPVATADTATAVFTFDAEAGAHPVSGRSGEWSAPGHEVRAWEHADIVKFDAATWSGADVIRVELNGPGLAPLTTGHYADARQQATAGPGMLVIANSLGCWDSYGEFTITRIERDAAGSLTALDATFTQRCGAPAGPALRGSIQYEA